MGRNVYFKQILDEHCGCASYVIASRQSNEVAIVDPAIETAQYAELLRDRHFTLRYVIDTHIHADHVSGARKLVAECGGELCMFEQAAVAEQIPARPLNMLTIEATNRGEADAPWAMLTSAPSVPEVDLPAQAERSPRSVLLDVREPDEYAIGHVPGAVNIPQAELASKLDEIPQDRPLMVICQGGARSLRAAQFLKQIGYDHVVSIAGGTNAWQVAGRPLTVGAVDATLDPGATRPFVADSAWTHAGVR